MTSSELLERVQLGEFLLVGELRGVAVQKRQFVDNKTGKKCGRIDVIHVIERKIRSALEIMKVVQAQPYAITEVDQVVLAVEKGRRYAFEIVGMKMTNGVLIAWMGPREPEPIE